MGYNEGTKQPERMKQMNLETANRLVEYRKKHNLSQEEVAEKIGVSRQAVSKWERVEASPDTDNLIALAHLYQVSLDELVFGKKPETAPEPPSEHTDEPERTDEDTEKTVNISPDGTITVKKDGKETVVVTGMDLSGVSRIVKKDGIHVHINDDDEDDEDDDDGGDETGVKVSVKIGDGDKPKTFLHSFFLAFPFYLIPTLLYVWFGVADICGGWAFGWLVFFSIPLYYSLIEAIFRRRPDSFAFPVLVTLFYLWYGIFMGPWHPTWLVFLTVPVYYFTCTTVRKLFNHSKEGTVQTEGENPEEEE